MAVLVLNDEDKEKARNLFGTSLVFNIHEAKGLEYKNVILYDFMSHQAYNGVWNIAKKETGETKIEEAIEKVRDSYDETIKDEENLNTSRSKNKEDKSFEEYKFYINALYVGVSRAEALKQIGKGNIEQARNIAKKELLNTEYAKEIKDALKAKGYHVEAQDSDKAISELKTENRASQEASTNESMTQQKKLENIGVKNFKAKSVNKIQMRKRNQKD